MKTQQHKVSEDGQAISKPNKQSSNSVNGEGNSSEPIPLDLIIEIFTRLHVKSIARCRCVSKLWSSILSSPHFTDLFLTRSKAHPKLLYICRKRNELFFFSSPQLQNPDEKSSSAAFDYHMKFPFDGYTKVCNSVSGLVCLKTINEVLVIYNPSTGQYLTLPKVNITKDDVMSFLGYDPIDKQFKLLSMPMIYRGKDKEDKERQILTLGNGEHSWRMIKCSIPHIPLEATKGICINGVLYYRAEGESKNNKKVWNYGVGCFDLRSEKFKFIEETKARRGKLVNYKGKLSILKWDNVKPRNLELSILEDDTWSKHTYVPPSLLKDVDAKFRLYITGLTGTGEIVLSYAPYLFYYNIERNTFIEVKIQGLGAFRDWGFTIFVDHVEDVKLGGMFTTS